MIAHHVRKPYVTTDYSLQMIFGPESVGPIPDRVVENKKIKFVNLFIVKCVLKQHRLWIPVVCLGLNRIRIRKRRHINIFVPII